MRIHVITNCSSTRLIQPLAKVEDLPSGLTNQEAIDKWIEMLNSHPKSTTPREQYRGQGFMTLLKTLTDFKDTIASTHIVTGGLGFTDIDEPIVPYDFSGSPKEEHNITQKVTKEPFSLSVWWSLINKHRHKDMVATFLETLEEDERCIISCTKIFLRYIAQDFLSASDSARAKCKILLTASSIGSVPQQLRPYIVSFERAAIQHIPGNRNDINHRAMYHMLDGVKDIETFDLPSWQLSGSLFASSSDEGGANLGVDVTEILKSRPQLLQLDPDLAYKTIYREVGPFGGRQNFKGLFVRMQMDAGIVESQSAEADDDALEALGGLTLVQAKPQLDNSTQESLQLLRVFIDAVRKAQPNAEFAPADICAWATRYTEKKGSKLPEVFTQAIKLAYFLKSYHEVLGLLKGDKTFSINHAVTTEAAE